MPPAVGGSFGWLDKALEKLRAQDTQFLPDGYFGLYCSAYKEILNRLFGSIAGSTLLNARRLRVPSCG
jgi:hypothetical protein